MKIFIWDHGLLLKKALRDVKDFYASTSRKTTTYYITVIFKTITMRTGGTATCRTKAKACEGDRKSDATVADSIGPA
jgi:hypothetical protein